MADKTKKTAPKGKNVPLKILPAFEPKLGRVYSNYLQVSHSQYEFTMRFADAPSGEALMRLKQGVNITIPNIVEIIVVPELIPEIIKALDSNYKKFIHKFRGTPKEDKVIEGH